MRKSNHEAIRALLRTQADGLPQADVARHLALDSTSTRRALRGMPDAYIDRWQPARRGQFEAVWCVADVPADCPPPEVRA